MFEIEPLISVEEEETEQLIDESGEEEEIYEAIRKNFTMVSNYIILNGVDFNATDKIVYLAIKQHCFGKKVVAMPSLERLMNATGLSNKPIAEALKRLEAKKVLKVERNQYNSALGKRYKNKYTLLPIPKGIKDNALQPKERKIRTWDNTKKEDERIDVIFDKAALLSKTTTKVNYTPDSDAMKLIKSEEAIILLLHTLLVENTWEGSAKNGHAIAKPILVFLNKQKRLPTFDEINMFDEAFSQYEAIDVSRAVSKLKKSDNVLQQKAFFIEQLMKFTQERESKRISSAQKNYIPKKPSYEVKNSVDNFDEFE